MLTRYNNAPGISGRVKRKNNNRIKNAVEDDLLTCPDIWPSQSAPCLEDYIRYITNRNEIQISYLKEQFISCSEKDIEINQLCILPREEHANNYGERWGTQIENAWKRSVLKNANMMLKEDAPPAKRINQSLVYMQSWEPYLGAEWLQNFVQNYLRSEIEEMVQLQIQDQSQTSFEVGAKIVENYRNVLGARWANRMRNNINSKENRSLNQADQKASKEARRLKNSPCSLWQYPKSATCSSRYSGFEECTRKPSINKRVYPDCSPVKIKKCLCP